MLNKTSDTPSLYIQWKGTDVCIELECTCGWGCHFDGSFLYAYKCPDCGMVWVMPTELQPHKADAEEVEKLGTLIIDNPEGATQ